ncbi:MAG: hypothetical protein CSA33_05255 [Desulfobulbus propionicus]|nr:MAG: hypothetical protein CSA33_05255 [Desulfobulbus propionicus]
MLAQRTTTYADHKSMPLRKKVSALFTIFLVSGVMVQPAAGAENLPGDTVENDPGAGDAPSYEYPLDARHDPFVPFLSQEATQSGPDPNEIIDEDRVLTGMQLFEPGQLQLVAILTTDGERFAMAQDVTGKGYILRTGMLIGKRGTVKEIETSQVLIEERAVTRAGKEILSTYTMKLNKEGDE